MPVPLDVAACPCGDPFQQHRYTTGCEKCPCPLNPSTAFRALLATIWQDGHDTALTYLPGTAVNPFAVEPIFPGQRCPHCLGEHPGAQCPEPNLLDVVEV